MSAFLTIQYAQLKDFKKFLECDSFLLC